MAPNVRSSTPPAAARVPVHDALASSGSSQRVTPRVLVLTGFVLAAVAARLLPHPPNFTPIGAVALFAGATFAGRRAAFGVPLLAMLVSDLALEWTTGAGLHGFLPIVYALFAASVWGGRRFLAEARGPLRVLAACGASATLFYLVSNTAVWAGPGDYPHTLGGLLQSLGAALPFYRNDLLGHVVFSAALFGALAWSERRFPALLPRVVTSSVS